MNQYIDTMIRRRWLVIIVTAGLCLYLLPFVAKVRFDSSYEGSVPRGDAHSQFFKEVKEDFGNDQVAWLSF